MCKKIIVFIFIISNLVSFGQNWQNSYKDSKKLALATNKLILVDFWATWCGPCKRMESETWSKDEVKILLENYIPLKIDIDQSKNLFNKLGLRSIPYIYILDGNGVPLFSISSYQRKSQIIKLLKKFSLDMTYLQKEMIDFYKKENYSTSLRLAMKYQNFSLYIPDNIKPNIINLVKSYLKNAKNELSENEVLEQKIKLLYLKNYLILKKYTKVIKKIKKMELKPIFDSNKDLFNLIKYVSYKINNEESNLILNKKYSKQAKLLLK